jgi:hypothetical protein
MRYWIVGAAFALAIAGYIVWWFIAADRVEAATRAWIEQQRALGYVIEHDGIERGGFPYRIRLAVDNPSIEAPEAQGGWRWSANGVTGVMEPWNPMHVIARFEGRHNLRWRDGKTPMEIQAMAEEALASIVFTSQGALDRFSLDAGKVDGFVEGFGPFHAERVQVHERNSMPENGGGVSHDVAVRLDTVDLPPALDGPLGTRVARLHIQARLEGALALPPSAPALEEWRAQSGIIEVQSLVVDWGPLNANGDGTVTVDERLRPLGAFAARIKGFGPTLEAVAREGLMRREDAAFLAASLGMLAKPDDQGRATLHVPLTAQDGVLFIGPFKVAELEPVIR